MAETWNKKEREKKKQQQKKEKAEKKQERREKSKDDKSFDDMIAYVDENGNFSSTPPDPRKKVEVNVEDIQLGVPKQQEPDPADLIRKGTVTYFNTSKGFGFITDQQSQERIFVHINAVNGDIQEGSKVNFEVEKGPRGLNAVNVVPV